MIWLLISIAGAQDYRFPTTAAHAEFWYPTAYRDHSGVDWNCGDIRYDGHRGGDFGGGGFAGMAEGRDVVAAAPGIVLTTVDGNFDECTTADCAGGGGFGNYVKIQHPDGWITYYAHLKKLSVNVTKGDVVACGDNLAQMGSSGNSTGPHLHFELRDGDNLSHEPFQGSCSDTTVSRWTAQGIHGEIPGVTCDTSFPECAPVQTLSCGDIVDGANTMAGSQDAHQFYGCSEFGYTGPEVSFEVITDLDEPVTVRVSGVTADLDVYVLETPACDTSGCLTYSDEGQTSDEEVTWDAVAAASYTVVLDGWEDAESEFHLEVDCAGSLPQPDDTGVPDDTGSQETDTDADWQRVPNEGRGGCGCAQTPTRAAGWWLALGLLIRRRRRA